MENYNNHTSPEIEKILLVPMAHLVPPSHTQSAAT